jgi:hypothetical protein
MWEPLAAEPLSRLPEPMVAALWIAKLIEISMHAVVSAQSTPVRQLRLAIGRLRDEGPVERSFRSDTFHQ